VTNWGRAGLLLEPGPLALTWKMAEVIIGEKPNEYRNPSAWSEPPLKRRPLETSEPQEDRKPLDPSEPRGNADA